ncbi:hypothetical protein C0J52_10149 [Blattella germanica]|nr:hypothetical protein C0J52_10149 [Blattella germanica]
MAAVPRVSRQDKFKLFNGLVCLAQGLEGKYTTVDLRNESCVTGKISQVDAQMNVVMSEAVFIDARGSEFPFDSFFIHARNIRYIHIPQQVGFIYFSTIIIVLLSYCAISNFQRSVGVM